MKIGNVEIKGNLFLAPMAGVTDVGFRKVCRDFGAAITTTEMISAKGLIYGDKALSDDAQITNLSEKSVLRSDFAKTNKEYLANKTACLLFSEENSPKIVQLFGSDPEVMAQACKHKLIANYDIIDINMGCPAPKIIKNNEGSKLMDNFVLAEKIIVACKNATNKPITVKFRKGFKKDVAVEFAKMCERAGASAITIHARLASQGYSGNVDYETIKAVKNAVDIPVIGSGDVKDFESYQKMLQTGVDGVMIGRGALGKPYIFAELNSEKVFSEKEQNKLKLESAKKHLSILRKYFKDSFLDKYLTKHFLWYANKTKNKDLKLEIAKANSVDRSITLLENILGE